MTQEQRMPITLPIAVPLARPVTVEGQTYSQLSFDEPTLAAQIAWAGAVPEIGAEPTAEDGARMLLFWICYLADVPEAVARALRARDLRAVEQAVDQVLAEIGALEEGAEVGKPGLPGA